ncbi:MAG: D-arabinono-1,4-lactone oxidase [Dehalococcoidia bacterium]
MSIEWSNWSGSVRCRPHSLATPASEDEIVRVVCAAAREGRSIRVAGTGHSFTPLVATNGVVISLDRWQGLEAGNQSAQSATVRSGTKLGLLGELLFAHGLAMENLGDVDVQSLAGAIGTGTHGTGHTFRNISSQVSALRIVTANGEVRECSEDHEPDLFRAARVSMGMLGVVSTIGLRLVPAFRLHERVWRLPAEECLDRLDRFITRNERFEFFWYPTSDEAECKTLNRTSASPEQVPEIEGERVGWSAQILPSVRRILFNEMEYAMPADAGAACFRAVRSRMLARHPEVRWPVEYRTLAGDDAWLSPAYGRSTVTISIHQDARYPYEPFFDDIEPIFLAHGGRPHWGKIHSLTSGALRDLYPQWDLFAAERRAVDPDGRFMNDYLRSLFDT